jgi:hypothetical protein
MPFGLNNALATFQNMMNNIFIIHVRHGDTNAYMDDMIIATKPTKSGNDDKVHEETVRMILQTFRENHLFVKPEKCLFSQDHIEYLRFVISKDHLSMDSAKVGTITNWPVLSGPLCTLDAPYVSELFYALNLHLYHKGRESPDTTQGMRLRLLYHKKV